MLLKVNGKEETLEKELTILEYITEKNLNPERLVVEHNREIILKENLGDIKLKENDELEILSFVSGG